MKVRIQVLQCASAARPLLALLFAGALVWSAPAHSMSEDEARHLLVRTGFAATTAELARLKPLRYEHAVARLLKGSRTEATSAAPAWVSEPPVKKPDAAERQRQADDLRRWWFRELRTTPSPLTERMTLFWHAHFTSELRKVRSPQLMYRQNVLLRRHALGDFRALLHEVVKDPAMMVYLDAQANRKGHPDATLARQLLERFALGPGQYKERDVTEAARALSGWRVDENGQARLDEERHDAGVKTVLGRQGRLDADQLVNALLRHPQTAEWVVGRLWREFVSDTPDRKEVQRLAEGFRRGYQIKPLVRALLQTQAFRSPRQRGRMIKSPVELLVGTARQFDLAVGDDRELAHVSALLGQDLFDPPSATGWKGGSEWITGATLPARQQAVARLLRGAETDGGALELASGMHELNRPQLIALLLPVPPADPIPAGLSSYDLAVYLTRDPAYQLK